MRQKIVILIILSLLSLSNCASSSAANGNSINREQPSTVSGCAAAKGPDFFRCMELQSKRWEKIESAPGKARILSKEQAGDFINVRKEFCWYDFCRIIPESIYSPPWYKDPLVVGLITGGIGAFVGYKIGVWAASHHPAGAAVIIIKILLFK